MNKDKEKPPEPLDFFIWTVEDVGLWLEEINLGSYRQIFKENGVNGEYLESMSMFTTEQILRFNLLSLNPCSPSATPIDYSITCGPLYYTTQRLAAAQPSDHRFCTSRILNHNKQKSCSLHPVKENIFISLFASKSKLPILQLGKLLTTINPLNV
ncbi:uncharacterized protein Fot_09266 [Forsythia ovata]|uniref:SAM domain-containing protein n=1 Tax=Forsythia ovata TaxID=205694 RepID=A0ABD1WDI6_9LAMI